MPQTTTATEETMSTATLMTNGKGTNTNRNKSCRLTEIASCLIGVW